MKVINSARVEPKPVTEEGATRTTIRWLISGPEGAPTFAMRLLEVEPGGSTPLHQHPWEHEAFVLDGSAELISDSGSQPISAGDAVLIPSGERHQFRNPGRDLVRFLCVIPLPDES